MASKNAKVINALSVPKIINGNRRGSTTIRNIFSVAATRPTKHPQAKRVCQIAQ